MIADRCRQFWNSWDHFWFGFDHPLGLALARIQLGLVLIYTYTLRHADSLAAFSEDGMVPRRLALPMIAPGQRPSFGWFELWPDSATVVVHGLFLLLCVLFTVGAWSRWIGWLAWILHIGFIQRNYSILFGADVISSVLLFYLAFTRCDERLSVRAWLGRVRPRTAPEALSSAFTRLLQVQLAVIYAYTGLEKLRGASWWDGTALWTVLGNPQMVLFNVDWVRNAPLAIAGITFVTVIFEIYWPFAVAIPRLRPFWLAMGVAFHSGIAILMGLWTFSLVMMSPYWLFLRPQTLDRAIVSIREFAQRNLPFSRSSR